METDNGNGSGNNTQPVNGKSPTKRTWLKPPWKKGQSGNPKGMPKGARTFTSLVREKLAERVPGESRTRLDRLAEALEQQALEGSTRAANLILERLDPAPNHSITINNNLRAPIFDALERIGVSNSGTTESNGN